MHPDDVRRSGLSVNEAKYLREDKAAAEARAEAAESRLSSVAGLVEAATALAPVQDPELPPDAHCILTVRLSASSTVKMPLGEWGKFMALREALDALGQ